MTFSVYQYQNFAGQLLTTTASTTLGTVPASTQWLVKDINICNVTGGTVVVGLILNGLYIINASIPGGQTLHWTGLRVLAAAQTIVAGASVANAIYVTVDGQSGV